MNIGVKRKRRWLLGRKKCPREVGPQLVREGEVNMKQQEGSVMRFYLVFHVGLCFFP